MDTTEFFIWTRWKAGAPLDQLAARNRTGRAEVLRIINKIAAKIDKIQGIVNREADVA